MTALDRYQQGISETGPYQWPLEDGMMQFHTAWDRAAPEMSLFVSFNGRRIPPVFLPVSR
jgi:hypothetical protein